MRHFYKKIYILILLVLVFVSVNYKLLPTKNIETKSVEGQNEKWVYAGGFPIGIYLKYDGVMIAKIGTFSNEQGLTVCPCKGILKSGDVIRSINDTPVSDKMTFLNLVENCQEDSIILEVERGGEIIKVKVKPQYDKAHTLKLGLWVRDDTQGIGTVTYIDDKKNFAALGHSVNDVDCVKIIPINYGFAYKAQLIGVRKGLKGSPGEYVGAINYDNSNKLGTIESNKITGIYGEMYSIPSDLPYVKVGNKYDIKQGKAQIISYVSGKLEYYDIEILNLDYSHSNVNKGIEFVVTDRDLLSRTNGIVQGMSGSPIIQDGKIIGAVTHVLVNDPTRGYGIFIENMMKH